MSHGQTFSRLFFWQYSPTEQKVKITHKGPSVFSTTVKACSDLEAANLADTIEQAFLAGKDGDLFRDPDPGDALKQYMQSSFSQTIL